MGPPRCRWEGGLRAWWRRSNDEINPGIRLLIRRCLPQEWLFVMQHHYKDHKLHNNPICFSCSKRSTKNIFFEKNVFVFLCRRSHAVAARRRQPLPSKWWPDSFNMFCSGLVWSGLVVDVLNESFVVRTYFGSWFSSFSSFFRIIFTTRTEYNPEILKYL